MGSGALCISCNLHKDSPAPQAEEGAGSACRAGQPAFMRRHMAAVPMGSDTFYNERKFLWEVVYFAERSHFVREGRAGIFFRQKSE